MTRFNFTKQFATSLSSISCNRTASTLLFTAILIVCSVVTGCSSEKPQPVAVNQAPISQIPATPAMSPAQTAAIEPAKPAPKKNAHKRPATVTYADKSYGVSFDYPRKYAIETGNAATELISTSPLPTNFVQPGGTALAAVELPETSFPSTDFSSAFFNVSVNKTLSAEQCEGFSVPQAKASDPSGSGPQLSKLMVGDMELYGAEAVTGDGPRQSDTKYFHIFQNGTCYEFALNVTTNASEIEAGMKHLDRDKAFDRLAKILATVRISEVPASEVTASTPVTPDDGKPAATAPASDSQKVEAAKQPEASNATANTTGTPVNSSVPSTPATTESSPQ